eukprot:746406-Hanusia_phi.AAC.2
MSSRPAERSFKDMETIMSLINHIPVLNALSVVQKYLICRQGRYSPGDVDEIGMLIHSRISVLNFVDTLLAPVFNEYSNALLVVLYGTLESSDDELLEAGSVIGIKDFIDIMEDKEFENQADRREVKYTVKTQALLLRVDLVECKMAFNAYERTQRQGLTRFEHSDTKFTCRTEPELTLLGCNSYTFIASSLSCVNIFQSWSWLDVLALVKDVEGVQIDKDVYLSRQGDEVSGLHILHWGECQIEIDGIHLSTSPSKSSRQSLLNGTRSMSTYPCDME